MVMKDKPRSRISLTLILIASLSIAILGQQVPPQSAPNVDRIRQHVTYLASDALEGRRTGSPGANDAAHYIAGEYSRLGLRPGIQGARATKTRGEAQSRFLQSFSYVTGVDLGKDNALRLKPQAASSDQVITAEKEPLDFRTGQEWMPLAFSSAGLIKNAPVTLVGYGITASELNYDDYAGADVRGHVVIAFSGIPDGDNPHGEFARYEDVRWKAIAARNAGANALLLVAQENNLKEDRLLRVRYDNNTRDTGLPVAAISRQAAQRILSAGTPQLSLLDLEKSLRETRTAKESSSQNVGAVKSRVSRLLESVTLTLKTDIVRHEVKASNVIGVLEGSDPTLRSEAIVIGAHYDHLGHGGEGSLAPKEGEIHHGADDNASGVAGVLELARIFTAQRPRPRRTIVFIAFSGEEEGLLGSNYYVNHPIVPLANTIAMINMDMIGRMKNNKLIVGGIGTAQEWRQMVKSANPSEKMNVTASGQPSAHSSQETASHQSVSRGMPIVVGANGGTIVSVEQVKNFDLTLNEDGYGPSDHSSFYAKKVPVLFLWTGTHEDYHKPSDTADKINYMDEARILGFVARLIHDIDTNDKRPIFAVAKTEPTGRAIGFRVYLGTIPNYADSSDGLLLDGVRDDSPAARAGIKAGDRVVKLAGREVHNVYDYTYALGEMKAGQEYEVELVRGSERIKLRITPVERK
jgi:peptidase M28-like protein/PDZ domain-containing protein